MDSYAVILDIAILVNRSMILICVIDIYKTMCAINLLETSEIVINLRDIIILYFTIKTGLTEI